MAIESVSIADNSQSYLLKIKPINEEVSIEIPKVENTVELLALSEYQKPRFFDGKFNT